MDFEKIFKEISIPEISENTDFWMMRTKRGVFFNEFIQNNYIAIGWNQMTSQRIAHTKEDELKQILKEEYKEKVPGSALNKCNRFIWELKEADIVMMVGLGKIAFAMVGEYYEESSTVCEIERELEIHMQIDSGMHDTVPIECPYIKRRRIKIIKILDTGYISPYLFKALVSNRHSLSSLNEYYIEILSSCFDIYNYNGITTITFRVQQQDDIDSIALSSFIYHTTKLLSVSSGTPISAKVNVHSEGDIILQIANGIQLIQQNWLPIITVFAIIGGGKIGSMELPSVLTIVKKISHWKYDNIIKREEAREKELENNKKQEELEILKIQKEKAKLELEQEIECYAKEIYISSKALSIKSVSDNIIPLNQWLESEIKE